MDNTIYFGTAYYDEYMPVDRLEDDFRLMKDAGINVIRIAESTWSTMEPKEGVYDFSSLHRMLDACMRYRISAIVGTPSYAIPPWLAKKYPDILADTFQGPSRYGHRQNMNLLHPKYRNHAERMIRKLLEEVAPYSCVIGYQIDNETKSYDTAGEDVQAAFVDSLRKQFTDISEFNRRFGLAYWSNSIASWEDFPDIRGCINGSLVAQFRCFQRSLVTDFLLWQKSIITEYMKPDQFITHNFDFAWIGHSYGYQPEVNQFEAAGAVSVAGVDIYHPTGNLLTGAEIAFGGNIGRALKSKPYFVLETQAQGCLGFLPHPGQLRLHAYSHLGSGAHMIEYWHWHSIHNSFESYWKGILSHNLKPNRIYAQISEVGKELQSLGNSILVQKKRNSIAVLLSNDSLTGLEEFPISSSISNLSDNTLSDHLSYNNVLRWICDALYELNFEYDFCSADSDSYIDYPVVIAPALYSLSDERCIRLKEYVAAGGHLIATFKTAFSDEYLKIYHDDQPHSLTDCFGMTYDLFSPAANAVLCSDCFDCKTPVLHWMEFLEPTTAQTLVSYDLDYQNSYAAVTANSYKKGCAYYIGCDFASKQLKLLLLQILHECKLEALPLTFPFIVKKGENSMGKKLIYLYNYSNTRRDCHFSDLFDNLSTIQGNPTLSSYTDAINRTMVNLDSILTLEPWGVSVFIEL